MDKKFHFVYQTKNIVNGKTYIGVHSTNNLNDGYIGSGIRGESDLKSYLKNKSRNSYYIQAVVKHGINNFKVEILSFYDTREEAFEEEIFLVTEDWVRNTSNYNTALGGSGGQPRRHCDKFEDIRSDYKLGMSAQEIYKKYNVSSSIACEALSSLTKSCRQNREDILFKKRHAHRIPIIISLLETHNLIEIKKKLKLGMDTLHKLIEVYEIDTSKEDKYVGVHVSGMIKYFYNVRSFCEENRLPFYGVSEAIYRTKKPFQDWTFLSKVDYENGNFKSYNKPSYEANCFFGLMFKKSDGSDIKIDKPLKSFCKEYNFTYRGFIEKLRREEPIIGEYTPLYKEFYETKQLIKKPLRKLENYHLTKDIIDLRDKGLTLKSIGTQLKLTKSNIASLIKRYNYEKHEK